MSMNSPSAYCQPMRSESFLPILQMITLRVRAIKNMFTNYPLTGRVGLNPGTLNLEPVRLIAATLPHGCALLFLFLSFGFGHFQTCTK